LRKARQPFAGMVVSQPDHSFMTESTNNNEQTKCCSLQLLHPLQCSLVYRSPNQSSSP
jgi:hypothetical protein